MIKDLNQNLKNLEDIIKESVDKLKAFNKFSRAEQEVLVLNNSVMLQEISLNIVDIEKRNRFNKKVAVAQKFSKRKKLSITEEISLTKAGFLSKEYIHSVILERLEHLYNTTDDKIDFVNKLPNIQKSILSKTKNVIMEDWPNKVFETLKSKKLFFIDLQSTKNLALKMRDFTTEKPIDICVIEDGGRIVFNSVLNVDGHVEQSALNITGIAREDIKNSKENLNSFIDLMYKEISKLDCAIVCFGSYTYDCLKGQIPKLSKEKKHKLLLILKKIINIETCLALKTKSLPINLVDQSVFAKRINFIIKTKFRLGLKTLLIVYGIDIKLSGRSKDNASFLRNIYFKIQNSKSINLKDRSKLFRKHGLIFSGDTVLDDRLNTICKKYSK